MSFPLTISLTDRPTPLGGSDHESDSADETETLSVATDAARLRQVLEK
jgi:hypothetical protein